MIKYLNKCVNKVPNRATIVIEDNVIRPNSDVIVPKRLTRLNNILIVFLNMCLCN